VLRWRCRHPLTPLRPRRVLRSRQFASDSLRYVASTAIAVSAARVASASDCASPLSVGSTILAASCSTARRGTSVLAIPLLLLVACHRAHAPPPSELQAQPSPQQLRLAKEYQANLGWIENVRTAAERGPVLTASLQREWLSGRPIVFPGVLVDAVIVGNDRYVLQIRVPEFYLNTELQEQFLALQLECSAQEVTPLLRSDKSLTDRDAVDPTLSVVAKISRVETTKVLEVEDKTETEDDVDDFGRLGGRSYQIQADTLKDWKVGFGECVHVEAYRP